MDNFNNWNDDYDYTMNDNNYGPQINSMQRNNPRGPGGGAGMPLTAPPSYVPQQPISTFRVDASSIRNCVGRFTYIWLNNREEFWMFPVQVSRSSVSGFRWNRRFGWTFFGLSLDRIDSFMCV